MLLYKYTKITLKVLVMGTTIVMALLTDEFLLFGNIGDSSGFVIKTEKYIR